MPNFRHGEVEIAYLDEGEGEPIVLVHGFASTKEVNWVNPGWVRTLTGAGRRAIALDNRGHGASSKLYDPADYAMPLMADDVRALLDHLAIERADIMGYSMGARITAFSSRQPPGARTLGNPRRPRRQSGRRPQHRSGADHRRGAGGALTCRCRASGRALIPQLCRTDQVGSQGARHLHAPPPRPLSREQVAGIHVPMLVAVGTADEVAGSAHELAALIPGARALDIPNRDHMLAVGDKVFKTGVLDFLNQRN